MIQHTHLLSPQWVTWIIFLHGIDVGAVLMRTPEKNEKGGSMCIVCKMNVNFSYTRNEKVYIENTQNAHDL